MQMEDSKSKKIKIKEAEKHFLNQTEFAIENKYKTILFEKYKLAISKIQECYENPRLNLTESKLCADENHKKYEKIEENFTRMLKKLEEGIIICTKTCASGIEYDVFIFYFKKRDYTVGIYMLSKLFFKIGELNLRTLNKIKLNNKQLFYLFKKNFG